MESCASRRSVTLDLVGDEIRPVDGIDQAKNKKKRGKKKEEKKVNPAPWTIRDKYFRWTDNLYTYRPSRRRRRPEFANFRNSVSLENE